LQQEQMETRLDLIDSHFNASTVVQQQMLEALECHCNDWKVALHQPMLQQRYRSPVVCSIWRPPITPSLLLSMGCESPVEANLVLRHRLSLADPA
jgi:hypothetical protein